MYKSPNEFSSLKYTDARWPDQVRPDSDIQRFSNAHSASEEFDYIFCFGGLF